MTYYKDDEITIRNLEQGDIKIFVEEENAQGWNATADKFEMRLRHQTDGKSISLVAEYNREQAGYINVYPNSQWGAFANMGYPEIVDFSVLEKFRRKGIGTRLMEIAEQISSEYADTVYLGVVLYPRNN